MISGAPNNSVFICSLDFVSLDGSQLVPICFSAWEELRSSWLVHPGRNYSKVSSVIKYFLMRTRGHLIPGRFSHEYFKLARVWNTSLNLLFKQFERSRHLICAHTLERAPAASKASLVWHEKEPLALHGWREPTLLFWGYRGWGGSFGRMRSNNTKWVLSQRASGHLLAQNKRARVLTMPQSSPWDSKLEMNRFYCLRLVFETLERCVPPLGV